MDLTFTEMLLIRNALWDYARKSCSENETEYRIARIAEIYAKIDAEMNRKFLSDLCPLRLS